MGRTIGSKNRPRDEIESSKKAPESNLTGLSKDQKKAVTREKKAVAKAWDLANKVYEYTPLAETALGATSLYNLYGIVIDA